MEVLHRFFAATFKPFFLCTGAATALIGVYAFFPEWSVSQLAQLEYLRNYTIIVQHWGIMVGLMGLFMMGAAIVPAWRLPILVFSGIEKAFMVWVVLSNVNQDFTRGFWIPAALDSTVVCYTVLYFLVMGFHVPIPVEKSSKM
jgi:hypothetical protein